MDHTRRKALVQLSWFTALISGLAPGVSKASSSRQDRDDLRKRPAPFLSGLIGDEAAGGEKIEVIVKGRNLAETYAVEFASPLITSRVVVACDTTVTVELNISPEIDAGSKHFFVCTPFGRVDSRTFGLELRLYPETAFKLAQTRFQTPPPGNLPDGRFEDIVQNGIGGDLL